MLEPPTKIIRPTIRLTPKQHEATALLGGPARHIMLYGGSRSGKTFALIRAIVIRALGAPGSRHAVFRHRLAHIRSSIWADTFPKVMRLCFPALAFEANKSELWVRFGNGAEIWFCGLDDAERTEKVLGQEFATLYFNECSQISFASVLTARTRLAQACGLRLKSYYDCNPPGTMHWTSKLFVHKIDPAAKGRQALPDPDAYASMVLNPVDNADNLPPEYMAELAALPERQRQRFLLGKFTAELDNALWSYELFRRAAAAPAKQQRVIVSVDPSGASGPEDKRSDEIGIVVAAREADDSYYVLADRSLRGSPAQWAARAVAAYREFKADRIVAEANFGGEMVRAVLQAEGPGIPVSVVHHSRGKVARAEPIAALYEKGLVQHVGEMADLEEQMVNMTTAGYMGDRSPDRLDAAVWALSELSQGTQFRIVGSV